MTFSSPVFLFLFFPLTVLLYFLIPAKFLRARNALLTAASLIFYAFGEPVAMLLMLAVVAWSWGSALLMGRFPKQKRLFQVLGVLGDLAVLILYKYADFLITSANDLFGTAIPLMHLRLPIGISFFVFQAVSYVMDTARGEAQPQKSYFRLLLYIAFFPQLIAGPIVRYQTVAEALSGRKTTPEMLAKGVRRMIFGLSKKLLIADTLGQIADSVFGMTDTLALPTAWLGAVCYAFQIFYDFSGYSDMAIGMGQIFGFSFPENFRYPYCAGSLTDFWRRWHISLTTWFRQYLYIPLGGNRRGRFRTVLNKWIVFLCTGLWHGASWNFVIWGIIHGFFMTLEQLVSGGKPNKKKRSKAGAKWYLHIYTLLVVVTAFVIFRADDLPTALRMYRAMYTGVNLSGGALSAAAGMLSPLVLTVFGAAVLFAVPLPEKIVRFGEKRASNVTGFVLGGISLALLVLCVMNAAATVYHPFIYFRF